MLIHNQMYYFKLFSTDNIYCQDNIIYTNLQHALSGLFYKFFTFPHNSLTNFKIVSYYMDIHLNVFSVEFRNDCFYLIDTDGTIKISSIIPEFSAYDVLYRDKNRITNIQSSLYSSSTQPLINNQTNHPTNDIYNSNESLDQLNKDAVQTLNKITQDVKKNQYIKKTLDTKDSNPTQDHDRHAKIRHMNFIKRAEMMRESVKQQEKNNKDTKDTNGTSTVEKINTVDSNKQELPDDETANKKYEERTKKIVQNRNNEKMNIFMSDKKVYIQLKKDIENGLFSKDNINPYYVMKYQIFRVLEERKSINFESDENIDNEYKIFTELYDACNEDEDETVKVYIPHNYHYMTDLQKTEHAKKYKMTREQFEEKYVNCVIDDINPDQKKIPETASVSLNE